MNTALPVANYRLEICLHNRDTDPVRTVHSSTPLSPIARGDYFRTGALGSQWSGDVPADEYVVADVVHFVMPIQDSISHTTRIVLMPAPKNSPPISWKQ